MTFPTSPLAPLIPVPGRVLGVDPGLNVTGYAVVESAGSELINLRLRVCEAGVVRTSKTMPFGERLTTIFWGINEVLEAHRPEAMALEQLYSVYKHPRTAILMGHARGVIFLAAAQRGVPIVSYAATRVKKTVTGSGRAPKAQIQLAIQQQLGLDHLPEPHDVADALALAVCHHFSLRVPRIAGQSYLPRLGQSNNEKIGFPGKRS